MRVLTASSLVLALGCAAPRPSAVPLGGEEWVKPERHVDRRPRAEDAERPQLAGEQVAPARALLEPSAPTAAAKDEPKASPDAATAGEVRFELRPFAVGSTVTVDGRLTIKAAIMMNLQGATSSQTIEFEAEQQLKARVTEMRGDEVSALELEYVKRRTMFRMPGVEPDEDSSGAGKRYRVTLQGRSMRVEALGFPLEPDEDKEVQRDLAPIIGYWPMVKPGLPANLATGWRHAVSDAELATLFASAPGARFTSGQLSFVGRDASSPDRALFGCRVAVQFEKDGASVGSDLDGQCVVRPSDTRPLELHLRGDLRADTPLPFGAESNVTGTVELEVKQSYSPR